VGRKRQLDGEHTCSRLFRLRRNLKGAANNFVQKIKTFTVLSCVLTAQRLINCSASQSNYETNIYYCSCNVVFRQFPSKSRCNSGSDCLFFLNKFQAFNAFQCVWSSWDTITWFSFQGITTLFLTKTLINNDKMFIRPG